MEQYKEELLKFASIHDIQNEIYWTEDLEFAILCNDVFFWGCADAEEITEDDLELLKDSVNDAGDFGTLLFCARKRKMRPQGAMYECIDKEYWPLFDEAGPERNPNDPGNTPKPSE